MSGSAQTGAKASLNVNAATQLAAVTVGMRIGRVSVTTAGASPGAIYDSATIAGAGSGNQVATVPNAVGVYLIDVPCFAGIVFVPGVGMVASASYD